MYKPYYKKIDRSMLDWGFTIPKDYTNDFLAGKDIPLGESRKIFLYWDNSKYAVKLWHVNRRKCNPVYQLRWDNNKDFLKKFRKTFIQSYVNLKSQKELFDITRKKKKHFRTKLEGGEQEVIVFHPINKETIKCKVFIKIENKWNTLFQRLAEENVFNWVFNKTAKQYLIQRSTYWTNVKDFTRHQNASNVIYYLVHTKRKLIYIGKADILGKRVKPGRPHQNMPGDWDIFKYDIIRQEFSNILKRIEDHTIRAYAAILKNNKNYPSLNIGDYTLINSNWKKL